MYTSTWYQYHLHRYHALAGCQKKKWKKKKKKKTGTDVKQNEQNSSFVECLPACEMTLPLSILADAVTSRPQPLTILIFLVSWLAIWTVCYFCQDHRFAANRVCTVHRGELPFDSLYTCYFSTNQQCFCSFYQKPRTTFVVIFIYLS